jgi:hypothetical protein
MTVANALHGLVGCSVRVNCSLWVGARLLPISPSLLLAWCLAARTDPTGFGNLYPFQALSTAPPGVFDIIDSVGEELIDILLISFDEVFCVELPVVFTTVIFAKGILMGAFRVITVVYIGRFVDRLEMSV